MSIPTCIVYWDADGNVIGTLDHKVEYDDDGVPLGLVDFESHELAGGRLREVAEVSNAVGAGTWPEWIGGQAMGFKVELRPGSKGGTHLIDALVHKTSGVRRERAAINAVIASTLRDKGPGDVVDIRPIIGSPTKSLLLDKNGNTVVPVARVKPNLPLHPKR